MFSRNHLVFFLAIALPSFVVAVPTGSGPSNQCNTQSQMCCETVTDSKDPRAQQIFKEHNIEEPAVLTPVALSCSSSGVVSVGGAGCSAQPVCCDKNTFGGLISIGCTPIGINL